MKQRILTGWNLPRLIYLLAGSAIVVQSGAMHEWLGVLMGGYFACMGLFAIGCAAGQCFTANESEQPRQISKEIESVHFEEIK